MSVYHKRKEKLHFIEPTKIVSEKEWDIGIDELGLDCTLNDFSDDDDILFIDLPEFSDTKIKEKGRELFVNGFEVYVLSVDRLASASLLKKRLRPKRDTDKEWNNENIWTYLEWLILEVPEMGVYAKGEGILEVLEILVESYYNGYLNPSARKVALGKILNALNLKQGKGDYKSLAVYQWGEAKRRFMEENDMTEEEFKETRG